MSDDKRINFVRLRQLAAWLEKQDSIRRQNDGAELRRLLDMLGLHGYSEAGK